jgi:hypothetical protein
MRTQWSCPDVADEKTTGAFLPIESTDVLFPECPAAYLRMPSDLTYLGERFGKPAFAPHLEGGQHPVMLISTYAGELELGARRSSSLSPLVVELCHLYMAEKSKFRARESELRREQR